jgi:hypothetical protein
MMNIHLVHTILNNLLNNESGQDLIEYALIAALIAVGVHLLHGFPLESDFQRVQHHW